MEMTAFDEALAAVPASGLRAVTLEGEPGIGKTHLLEAVAEMAEGRGFVICGALCDEEIRGPFLVSRSLLGSATAEEAAREAGAGEELLRLREALSGHADPTLESFTSDKQVIGLYDLAAVAVRAMAAQRPVALLLDDVQWADQDSIRMLRYVVRAAPDSPILVVLAMRPEESGGELATLIADMERLRVARRLRLSRFGTTDTATLLREVLGDDVSPSAVSVIQSQAEGVPFMVEELSRAYRDAGLLQLVRGAWELSPKAERLLPHSVEMLIRRRVDRLPEEARTSLAEAAIVGRTFGLRDLAAVKDRLGEETPDPEALSEALSPAVTAGLLTELPEGWAADYRFAHEQVRQFAAATLSRPRRRAIHGAIVDLLVDAGPPPEALAVLAHHALSAGLGEQCARYSIEAARVAIDRNAPDETLRLVDESLASAQNPRNRVELLRLRDDALEALRRPAERLHSLPQLAALAEALGDPGIEIDVTLRRAAALRLSGEEERAVELAEEARDRAREAGDRRLELRAVLELGQAALRSPLGQAAGPSVTGDEMDRAEEAYEQATSLAAEVEEPNLEAAAWRELGSIWLERARKHFYEFLSSPDRPRLRNAPGSGFLLQIPGMPELVGQALSRFTRALDLYERLGDQRGMMVTLIAMAYARTGADIRFGSARRIEDLRRIIGRLQSLVRESERDRIEVEMLYAVHLYARAFGFPDLALERGRDAHRGAGRIGDRAVEFLAAGGTALVHLGMGDQAEAQSWLDRAAETVSAAPTALRTRDLEMWRGMAAAASGDVEGTRRHLERALAMAAEQGKQASRCEVLARLALELAQLGWRNRDPDLLSDAAEHAAQAHRLATSIDGDHPWTAQAEAARALVLHAQGSEEAVPAARAALEALESLGFRESEPPYPLHLDVILAALRILSERGDPSLDDARTVARTVLQMVGERTMDEEVRVRWFRAPVPRELAELAGPVEVSPTANDQPVVPDQISDREAQILRMITDGMTNQEIAQRLQVGEDRMVRELAEIYAKLGVSSRAGATVFAMMEGVA